MHMNAELSQVHKHKVAVVFLYPWAVAYDQLALFGLIEMVIFILTVFVAYTYVWRRGGLEWD
jgi:NADH-quinone oxidoreductase subunit A